VKCVCHISIDLNHINHVTFREQPLYSSDC
jgi:hypothetical protein